MKRLVILIVSAILSFSCVSKEAAVQPEPAPEVPAVKEEATHIDETPPPAKPEPQKSPKPEEPREAEPEPAFEVTREVYNQTFDEMRVLINKLNKIIADKNYGKWKYYLSEEYIRTYNNRKILREISENSQILADNNIVLNNLKDYFEWVVVPSRSKASVDDIVFVDEDHLMVYMMIRDQRSILYQLEKIQGRWLISNW